MEYYFIKTNRILMPTTAQTNLENAKEEKPVSKGHVLHHSICVECLE